MNVRSTAISDWRLHWTCRVGCETICESSSCPPLSMSNASARSWQMPRSFRALGGRFRSTSAMRIVGRAYRLKKKSPRRLPKPMGRKPAPSSLFCRDRRKLPERPRGWRGVFPVIRISSPFTETFRRRSRMRRSSRHRPDGARSCWPPRLPKHPLRSMACVW
ncbi:hypothetical protein D3C72_1466010 [compost metagenome]